MTNETTTSGNNSKPSRQYMVNVWSGGEPGRGFHYEIRAEGENADEAREQARQAARKVLPRLNWVAGGARWLRPKVAK